MPYLGNPAVDRFTSTKAASVYSGDGSTVAFTLEHSVGADEDILVSVDGVIQEPSVAYAVSSGTTLTFTAAPSTNSGNNIFVYYLFRTIGTVTHPPTSALSATSGTFTGDVAVDTNVLKVDTSNNRVGINVTSPSRTLQIAGTDSNRVSSFTHSGDYAFATFSDQNTTNDGSVRVGAYGNDLQLFAGGSARVLIDTNGVVTKPAQPAFLAKVNSDQTNIATNSDVTVLFNVERFDQNADFDTGTYTFTAPVTGRYQLQTSLRLENVDTGGGYYQLKLVTSNTTYATIISPLFSADASYWNMSHTVIADMDASDTAIVKIKQLQGTAQTDIDIESYFSGFLVC